jgi:hypothetical protein
MLSILRSLTSDQYPWARMSHDPLAFLTLTDVVLEQAIQELKLRNDLHILEGTEGWQAVGTPWQVPQALICRRQHRVLQKQVRFVLLSLTRLLCWRS